MAAIVGLGLLVPTEVVMATPSAATVPAAITCKHISGYMGDKSTPYFWFGACTNHLTAFGYDAAINGEITWSDGTTTIYNDNLGDLIAGPNACGLHKLWVIVDGIVTGGTSTLTQVGEGVSFQMCGSPYTAISLRRKNHTVVSIY